MTRTHPGRGQRGQSLVESALALPLLVLLALALCQLCLLAQGAFFAQRAARRAARAYVVYCQKGPGYGLDMARQAAELAVQPCRPKPLVFVEIEDKDEDQGSTGEDDWASQAHSEGGDTGFIRLSVRLRMPLIFPAVHPIFGAGGASATLKASTMMLREDTEAYFREHEEIQRR